MNNRAEMASRLALVLGLGSVSAACGGKVIFEQSGGTGTGGAGGTSGTSTHGNNSAAVVSATTVGATTVGVTVGASSTSSGGGCNVPSPQPGDTLEHACFKVGATICPIKGSPVTKQSTQDALNSGQPAGCAQQTVDLVACGPDAAMGTCCYWVYAHHNCVVGRPFDVDGEARTGEVATRSDWSAGPGAAIEKLDAKTRARLADAWSRDGLIEHASVASFARFALELLALGAPADLVRDAQTAMGDEIRHAQLSFALATSYADKPVGPSAIPMEGALLGRSLADVAAATVREGCVNETLAALIAAEARDAATDASVRAALTAIAADEARHAELAWRTVAWALSTGGAEVRTAVEVAFDTAFASMLGASSQGSSRAGDMQLASDGSDLMRAHGQLDERAKAHVERGALEGVVLPTARAMLARFADASTEATRVSPAIST